MTNKAPHITVSEQDFLELMHRLEALPGNQQSHSRALQEELDRADVVATAELPDDVVRMNSIVLYEDLDNGRMSTVRLSFPESADIEQRKLPVLAPIGAALIGLKVGEVIRWPLPGGRFKRLRVRQLLPESQKDAC